MAREWWTAFSLGELQRLTDALDARTPQSGDAVLRAKLTRATLGLLRWNRYHPPTDAQPERLPLEQNLGGRRC